MILTPLTAAETATEEARALAEGWVKRSLVAFDQFINVTLFRGRNDETISAHAGRACIEGKLWGEALATLLNVFQVNHCVKAMVGDAIRARALLRTEDGSQYIVTV